MRPHSQAGSRAVGAYFAIALAELAVFFVHTATRSGGRPRVLFDQWLYNALILLAVVGVGTGPRSCAPNALPGS